ncbi:hypothetical protein BJ138DRAFT_1105286 [Hygrophoropsis aurantiaca]|uniref:Uncharacterized protein n=1 Tax=Hygrophoropsis aurantiaca TaxID=72124 RepID=A0ACB7ZYU1_9AGAM|nr:hypothetical protein BJ138DRAFT_1105286 [Hygrophoropsis aurantiaca]
MEKVSEEWTPHSITSVFRIDPVVLDRGFPNTVITSDVCGLGWRFEAVGRGTLRKSVFGGRTDPGNFEISIQPSTQDGALHMLSAHVRLTSSKRPTHFGDQCFSGNSSPNPPPFTFGFPPPESQPHALCQGSLQTKLIHYGHDKGPSGERVLANVSTCCLRATEQMTFEVTFAKTPVGSKHFLSLLSAAFDKKTPVRTVTPAPMRLEAFIPSGTPFDIQFIVFNSCRSTPARFTRPFTIHAHSTVMQAVLGGFSIEDDGGGKTAPLAIDIGDIFEYEGGCIAGADDCDYEFDSDFEGDEVPTETRGELRRDPDVLSDGESGVMLNSGSERGSQSAVPSAIKSGSMASVQDRTSTDSRKISFSKPAHIARMMLVRGAAYKTWHAFVYYCYTDQISFSPLKSQKSLSRKPGAARVDTSLGPPTCSPKSMYRLADKMQNARLKQIAFDAIRARLSKDNILREALSRFTARYPEIQATEIDMLVANRAEPELAQALPRAFQKQTAHSQGVLLAFMQRLLPV